MIDIKEFEKYLEVDPNALDEEIMRQPSLSFKVSEALAEVSRVRDKFKEQISYVDGRLFAQYKEAGGTDSAVKAMIQADPKHLRAFDKWLEAKELADKLIGLKDSFSQRSHNLRDLAKLYIADYFEAEAVKPTTSQDRVVYSRYRARIAEARDSRK